MCDACRRAWAPARARALSTPSARSRSVGVVERLGVGEVATARPPARPGRPTTSNAAVVVPLDADALRPRAGARRRPRPRAARRGASPPRRPSARRSSSTPSPVTADDAQPVERRRARPGRPSSRRPGAAARAARAGSGPAPRSSTVLLGRRLGRRRAPGRAARASTRARSTWRRNWWPRPRPSLAPSMRPGMSATTNSVLVAAARRRGSARGW